MNEEELGRRLADALSASADCVGEGAVERLRAAREAAVAVHRSSVGRRQTAVRKRRMAFAVAAMALAVVALGGLWSIVEGGEAEDLDAALLADDLPIDAYLDQDFKTWLEHG